MIVVDRSQARWTGTPDEWQGLAERVKACTCVHLPGFLAPGFLDEVRSLLGQTRFIEHRHQTGAVDERAEPGALAALLLLVLNDPELLSLVERLTGRGPLGGFEGRIYRMRADDEDSWHDDSARNRRAAISINLQREVLATAPLQIRRRDSDEILFEYANATPGDAVLFTVDRDHQHRVKPMPGVPPRIACSGWFYEGPDMRAWLRAQAQSSSTRSKT